jgi:hypothetical protein
MDYSNMTREQLIEELQQINEYMENVVVLWGDKRQFLETFREVSDNVDEEYTAQESLSAKIILENEGAFDNFINLLRDSFDKGGINYLLSEKVSAIMQEVADQFQKLS